MNDSVREQVARDRKRILEIKDREEFVAFLEEKEKEQGWETMRDILLRLIEIAPVSEKVQEVVSSIIKDDDGQV